MKIKINFRTWFSDHLVAVSFIFALTYQLLDIFLNYFVSGELKQGFSNFYQSPGGAEDLTRFLVILVLFIYFGAESRSIIRANIKAAEDQSRRLNEIKNFANAVIHDVKNPAIGIHTMAMLFKKKYGGMVDDQGNHYLELMEQTSKDIVTMMENINIFIRAREYSLTFEIVNIQHEIDIIRDYINPTLEVRRIQWHQKPETFPQIRGDRLSIHRILRNLLVPFEWGTAVKSAIQRFQELHKSLGS